MARLRTEGYSVRQIAANLDRSPSSIARELKRNASHTEGYRPGYADQQARARRWSGSKLDRDRTLRALVLGCLRQGWSPQQVARRLALEDPRSVISHETIYRFIYAQIARTKEYAWRLYLPRAKSKRGRRRPKARSSASFITLRKPLAERPADAAQRQTPGHWEADLMLFTARRQQAVLTLHERHSRLLIAARLPGKAAAPVATTLKNLLAPLPPAWRQSVTFDNGTEFAQHHQLHALGIQTFFCDTHSPWQKAASKTPSVACAAPCLAKPTSPASQTLALPTSCSRITIPLVSASVTKLPPRSSATSCCTSNVNPPSRFRGNDGGGGGNDGGGQ